MTPKFTILSAAFLAAIATSSYAQTSDNSEEAEGTAAEAAETPQATSEDTPAAKPESAQKADEVFPVEPAAPEEPQIGQQFIKSTHTDWQLRCIKGEETDTCGLYQLLKDSEGNGVAEFNLVALPKGSQAAGGVTMVTPLGTLLTAQTTIRIDSGKARRYPFGWCEQSGCVARFGLTDADVNGMKRGNKAVVTIASVAAPDKPIALDLSLSGFTAAWNELSAE